MSSESRTDSPFSDLRLERLTTCFDCGMEFDEAVSEDQMQADFGDAPVSEIEYVCGGCEGV